jgi:glycosyltransferase involved in cell wall biosynthesis
MNRKVQLHQFLVSQEFGGAAEIAVRLARHCHEASLGEPQVWVPGAGRAADQVRAAGLAMQTYNLGGSYNKSRVRSALNLFWLACRLRRHGKGLIHVHSPLVYGAMARALWMTGLKRVVHVQIEHDVEGLIWALRDPPDLIVTCAESLTDQVRSALPERYRKSQRIVAAPNAVDTEKFCPGQRPQAKQKVGAHLDRSLVLMLANLAPHKGQCTALRAVADLKQRGIQVQCWLAGVDRSGDGTYESRLRALACELGINDYVSFLGFRQDTPDLLQAADVLLLPSTNEGLPLAILEAQASGVPVIAAPTAGIPEVIEDGKTGFLVSADDHQSYAATIERLITDASRRDLISREALNFCRNKHGWAAFHQRMDALYAELLSLN